jgi:hypothetical protein
MAKVTKHIGTSYIMRQLPKLEIELTETKRIPTNPLQRFVPTPLYADSAIRQEDIPIFFVLFSPFST